MINFTHGFTDWHVHVEWLFDLQLVKARSHMNRCSILTTRNINEPFRHHMVDEQTKGQRFVASTLWKNHNKPITHWLNVTPTLEQRAKIPSRGWSPRKHQVHIHSIPLPDVLWSQRNPTGLIEERWHLGVTVDRTETDVLAVYNQIENVVESTADSKGHTLY